MSEQSENFNQVTEFDLRKEEFKDAKLTPEMLEFDKNGNIVRKDRFETGMCRMHGILIEAGLMNPRKSWTVEEVVKKMRTFTEELRLEIEKLQSENAGLKTTLELHKFKLTSVSLLSFAQEPCVLNGKAELSPLGFNIVQRKSSSKKSTDKCISARKKAIECYLKRKKKIACELGSESAYAELNKIRQDFDLINKIGGIEKAEIFYNDHFKNVTTKVAPLDIGNSLSIEVREEMLSNALSTYAEVKAFKENNGDYNE